MTLTLLNIPREVEDALRKKASAEGKDPTQVALDVLRAGLGLGEKKRDLSDIAGTWVDDPAFDEAREYRDQVDPELWR